MLNPSPCSQLQLRCHAPPESCSCPVQAGMWQVPRDKSHAAAPMLAGPSWEVPGTRCQHEDPFFQGCSHSPLAADGRRGAAATCRN